MKRKRKSFKIDKVSRRSTYSSGIVRRDMTFVSREYEPYYYLYGMPEWLKTGDNLHTPPLGIRSSVPLGGIGAGSVELRADGSFRDWQIWNNWESVMRSQRNICSNSLELTNTFLAICIQMPGKKPVGRILQTRSQVELPTVEEIHYSGAFPAAWLDYRDRDLPVNLTLTAWSPFSPHDSKSSSFPIFFLDFDIENTSTSPIEVSLGFAMQNHIDGTWNKVKAGGFRALCLKGKPPNERTNCTIGIIGEGTTSYLNGWKIAQEFWNSFLAGKSFITPLEQPDIFSYRTWYRLEHGSIIHRVKLAPGGRRTIRMVFAWYSPYFVDQMGNLRGHVYENWFKNSLDVVHFATRRRRKMVEGVNTWHKLCFDNTLPDWLKEALVNFPSHYFKTTWWLKDRRYLHLESLSCPNMEPIHVFLHASYIDSLLFPDLHQQILDRAASEQHETGFMSQGGVNAGLFLVEGGDAGRSKQLCSGMSYILMVYGLYRATGNILFLRKHWPHVLKALGWYRIADENGDGLPDRGFTTFDSEFFAQADTNCEAAILYIASLKAAGAMAEAVGDKRTLEACNDHIARASASVERQLWNGKYFTSYWSKENPDKPDLLYAFELLGAHAAETLGLSLPLEPEKIEATLDALLSYNGKASKWGIVNIVQPKKYKSKPVFPGNPGYIYSYEKAIWPASSFYVSAMLASLGRTNEAFVLAKRTYDNLARNVNELWNIPDGFHSKKGHPTINDHYTRHNILWTLPMALAGLQFDATSQHLVFRPKVKKDNFVFPLITASALGRISYEETGRLIEIEIFSGKLTLAKFTCGLQSRGKTVVLLDGKSLSVSLNQNKDEAVIKFISPVVLTKKKRFLVSFTDEKRYNK